MEVIKRKERARLIKAELVKRGIRQSTIADNLGIHRGSVCSVVNGYDSSRRVVRALIEAGVPEDLFDDTEKMAAQ